MVARSELSGAAVALAPRLLGAVLESDIPGHTVRVRLTEVEAYEGSLDAASHAYRGRTKRNEVMFGPPGHLYVYFVYGMHWCANVTCGPEGTAAAVLLRAGAIDGDADGRHGRGPARLARALGLRGEHTGLDLLDPTSPVRLVSLGDGRVHRSGPRTGVAAAHEHPWRFWLPDEPSVSPYRPHRKRIRSNGENGSP